MYPIVVEQLSKRYRIGKQIQETMLRDRLINLVRRPFRKGQDEYETLWALKDVSFKIGQGEVVGVVGRNGAGKSTLLKVLAKITFPTSGSVKVHGRVASLLEVGTGFHEELTGRENVFLNGSILGMTRREVQSKLDAIISFSGVEKFIDTPIKRYSSGMRLRLGFAVAGHLDPDILIVDEVLAVGDAGFQKKCLDSMEDLQRGGRTVLFVSHNMAAVENLCSRCIWIDNGKVWMDGNPQEVIRAYMATFAGSQQGRSDFNEVERRHGNGEIRYTGFEILSSDQEPLQVLRSGDPVIFRFQYHAEKRVSHTSFGFRLFTELGTLVTETSTWHHGLEIPTIEPGKGSIDLNIEFLNLLPGRYQFSLWITGESRVIHDGLEYCTRLDVEASNIYHSSRVIDGRYGIVFFPQSWNLSGLAPHETSVSFSNGSPNG